VDGKCGVAGGAEKGTRGRSRGYLSIWKGERYEGPVRRIESWERWFGREERERADVLRKYREYLR
jgi:hypothetical protein